MTRIDGDALHIRLLNLLCAIRDLSPFNAMSADEAELLSDLILLWHEKQDITVTHMMRHMAKTSQTTAYRRLTALRDKGFLRYRIDPNDKRVKFVEPTDLAERYAKSLNDGLQSLIVRSQPSKIS